MSRRALASLAPLALLALAGCGHTEVHTILLRAPEPPAAHDTELYFEGRGPNRPFSELAVVQAIGYGGDANPDDVASALAEKGRAIGCDAIVRVRIGQGAIRAHAIGVCVRYLAPAPAPLPAPPPAPPPASPAPSL